MPVAMRQLVVIKTGSTIKALAQQRGDVEHWILAGRGLTADEAQVSVVDVRSGEPLPPYETLAGVTIIS